jgi:glycosyltransferase involved in cell wall biosynthesis
MQEMAAGLKERGHRISVVTTYPHNDLTAKSEKTAFDEYSIENSIDVIRIKTLPQFKVNYLLRGASQLISPYVYFKKIRRYLQKIDIVIVYSPPLTLTIVGKMVKKKYNAKFILNLQDIFPQNAIDLGIMNNRTLIKLFEKIEKRAYLNADQIIVHSEGNKKLITVKRNIKNNKVAVIPNWIDLSSYANAKKTGRFRETYGLDNKFVFLFAGIIGPSQGLDLIITLASNLREIPEICFLLVGDGSEKEKLIKETNKKQLTNMHFKPVVSKKDYPELVKDVDVGLVCLSSKNKTPVVPGKILGYMAASIPIIAFLNKESDGHKLIRDAKCGYTAVSDNEDVILKTILRIYQERESLSQYGKNGLTYAMAHFEKNICMDNLEKYF